MYYVYVLKCADGDYYKVVRKIYVIDSIGI